MNETATVVLPKATEKTTLDALKDTCKTLAEQPADPFRLVRTLKTGKDLYDTAVKLAAVARGTKPAGFPGIVVEFNAFTPPGHIVGLDVNGKVVLLIGPPTKDVVDAISSKIPEEHPAHTEERKDSGC